MSKITGSFTQVQNSLIYDLNLSAKAKFIFILIASKDNMPTPFEWKSHYIENFTGFGRDVVRSCLMELEMAGYISKRTYRKSGKFSGKFYTIDYPPVTENPSTVKPKYNNSKINNNIVNNKNSVNKLIAKSVKNLSYNCDVEQGITKFEQNSVYA